VDAVVIPVPAGWYDNPVGDDALRWWDGSGWSRHTSDRATAAPIETRVDLAALPAPDPDALGWDLADVEECLRIAALWRDTADRIREVVAHRTALVHVEIDRLPPIVIDTRYRAYGWRYPLAGLPPAPVEVRVAVQAQAPLAPTVFAMRHGAVADLVGVFEELARAEGV
jgi:hypothetical protein